MTLAAGPDLADSDALRQAITLPTAFAFGGILLFPLAKRRFVLARAVVANEALIELHRCVHRNLTGAVEQTLPGNWTPHVTLSRRLTAEQVAAALDALGDASEARFTGARLWDGETKTTVDLGSASG